DSPAPTRRSNNLQFAALLMSPNGHEADLPTRPAICPPSGKADIRDRLPPAARKLEAPGWRCWISRRSRRSLGPPSSRRSSGSLETFWVTACEIYSMISSAPAERPSGTAMPRERAVFRLSTNSNFAGLHDWQIGSPLAFENAPGIDAGYAVGIGEIGAVAGEPASLDKFAPFVDRR